MAAHKTFYAIVYESKNTYEIVRDSLWDIPLIAKTKRQIKKLIRGQDCPEELNIMRCEIVE